MDEICVWLVAGQVSFMWVVSVAAVLRDQPAQFDAAPWPVILFADRPVTCPSRWPVSPYHTAVEYSESELLEATEPARGITSRQSAESANNGGKRNACMPEPLLPHTQGTTHLFHFHRSIYSTQTLPGSRIQQTGLTTTYTWMEWKPRNSIVS